jgi:hypothetical protein
MEHSYRKHPCDCDNKNIMFIHKFEYISVIVLGCFAKTPLCLALFLYSSPPLPLQTKFNFKVIYKLKKCISY